MTGIEYLMRLWYLYCIYGLSFDLYWQISTYCDWRKLSIWNFLTFCSPKHEMAENFSRSKAVQTADRWNRAGSDVENFISPFQSLLSQAHEANFFQQEKHKIYKILISFHRDLRKKRSKFIQCGEILNLQFFYCGNALIKFKLSSHFRHSISFVLSYKAWIQTHWLKSYEFF